MTEEIVKNEEIKADKNKVDSKAAGFSLLKKRYSGKNKSGSKKTKGPDALGDFELVLVTLTGLVVFGGVIFSLVMITLMNSMAY